MRNLAISGLLLAGFLCLSGCVINGDDAAGTAVTTALRTGDGFRYEGIALGASREYVVGEFERTYDHVVEITDHLAHSSVLKATSIGPGEALATNYVTLGFGGDTLYAIMDYQRATLSDAELLSNSFVEEYGPLAVEAPEQLQQSRLYEEIMEFFDSPSYEARHWYDAERGYSMSMFVERLGTVGGPASGADEDEAVDQPKPDEMTTANVMVYIFDLAGLEANYETLQRLK